MNWMIFSLALAFSIVDTAHFGWHLFPTSDAEVICDGIFLLLLALSLMAKKGS